jgi:hypothetical protein
MESETHKIPPLLTAETAVLSFSASKDGKLRVNYLNWDDAKVALAGQEFVVTVGPQGVEARIRTIDVPLIRAARPAVRQRYREV